ncbi:MAG: ethylbenzene dehydrogenase-related protein [Phycisphaerae bacterium]|nr:ethylbenzene dehydrogenase-related protein [Phycisphaerae bacterium]
MSADRLKTTAIPVLWALGVLLLLVACSVRALDSKDASRPVAAVDESAPRSAPDAPEPDASASKAESGVAAAAKTSQSATALPAVDPRIVERGRALFARQCVVCHGETGDGTGTFAYLMNPRPRNFKTGKFRLTTTQNQVPSDEDLLRTITRGMPGSAMPPWGHLPISDLRALVAYVRQIHVDAVRAELDADVKSGNLEAAEAETLLAERTLPGAPIVVPAEPPFDQLRWFNGRRIYIEACASCHGADGHPIMEAVKFDDEGFPDPPRSFVNGIFKGGMEGPELYCRIMKGMRGTPMPASEGVYSADEVWDLIHYVQSLARSGSQDRARLQQGTFSAPRVEGALPSGPTDAAWNQARPLYVALSPLWWTEQRVEGLVVQALHNSKELALRLSWLDPTQDDRAVRVEEFRDAVAIQFSLSSDPPFYMGDASTHGGVNIWMWKADRQKNIADGYQDVDAVFPNRAVDMYDESPIRSKDMSSVDWPHGEITQHNRAFITAWGAGNLVADPTLKTPVECLVARGPGTLSGKPANVQVVQGQAAYERGVWMVQLQRTLELPHEHAHNGGDERVFRSGDYLPVSFAIWDGSAGDRDGKKNISIWQKLVIE